MSLITATLAACKTSEKTATAPAPPVAVDCTGKTYTYSFDIKPILEQYCTRCHGNAGGYDFTNFADVKSAALKGELLGTIQHAKGFEKMPANEPKLDQSIIDKIDCWIKNGMKE